jgi:hypothetical protein
MISGLKLGVELFLFTANLFFLIMNGSKAVLSSNQSGGTYLGIFLSIVTALYFAPKVYRIFRRPAVSA